jgi:hypothetical protein
MIYKRKRGRERETGNSAEGSAAIHMDPTKTLLAVEILRIR